MTQQQLPLLERPASAQQSRKWARRLTCEGWGHAAAAACVAGLAAQSALLGAGEGVAGAGHQLLVLQQCLAAEPAPVPLLGLCLTRPAPAASPWLQTCAGRRSAQLPGWAEQLRAPQVLLPVPVAIAVVVQAGLGAARLLLQAAEQLVHQAATVALVHLGLQAAGPLLLALRLQPEGAAEGLRSHQLRLAPGCQLLILLQLTCADTHCRQAGQDAVPLHRVCV